MDLETLGIDESVGAVFPPSVLVDDLADLPIETVLLDQGLDGCEGVVTFAHRDEFVDAGWVHSVQAGVDRFPHETFKTEGVVLTNSSGMHGDTIGETVASYVLAFARRLHRHVANQQSAEWSPPAWDEAWTAAGERACVVGLGGLGSGVVDRLDGLGLDIDGVRRTPVPEPGVETVYTPAELDTAVQDARFVVLAVPLTESTRGLIDGETLAAMREDAYLINVARGPVVDQEALVAALEDDVIAGAALDVFETEPLPKSSPLWEMDEVIISPHCGAYTHEYHTHIAALVRENVTRLSNEDAVVNRVL